MTSTTEVVTRTLSYDEAVRGVFLAICDRGLEYVYQPPFGEGGCLNWHVNNDNMDGGEPGCIVGWVMAHYFGNEFVKEHPTGIVGTTFKDYVKMDAMTYFFLDKIQLYQDSGSSWALSFSTALGDIIDVKKHAETKKNP